MIGPRIVLFAVDGARFAILLAIELTAFLRAQATTGNAIAMFLAFKARLLMLESRSFSRSQRAVPFARSNAVSVILFRLVNALGGYLRVRFLCECPRAERSCGGQPH